MIDRDKYLSHIDDQEKLIAMRKVLDKIEVVMRNHTIEYTDFLDPYEAYLAKSILNSFMDLNYIEYGGVEEAERKILIIFPDYMYEDDIPLGLSFYRVEGYLEKLSHPDYLGAILGLGIVRDKVGDIFVNNDYSYIVLKDEIARFVEYNLEKVRNNRVKLVEIEDDEIYVPEIQYKEKIEYLSSLRLDVVISGAYNMSRKDSSNLIKSEKVRVNWEPIDKPSYEVEVGDMISTRGFGRMLLYKVKGRSKKDRYISVIRLLV